MLTHIDLIERKAFVDPATGILWALRPDGALEQVTFPGGVTPAYRNLINASLLLYNANFFVGNGLQPLVDWAESTGNDRIVHAVTTFEANLYLSRRCAIDGIENVAAAVKKG